MQKMSIPNEEIENAILNWISLSPNVSNHNQTIDSLSDGIALTEIMCQISPPVFDTSKINMEASENWAFKLSNLTYLYEGLEKYYTKVLGKDFDKTYVDILKLSKNEDPEQLFNLTELVLGAAVQGEKKEAYINGILTLDDNCQNALMYLIEKILNKCNQEKIEESPKGQRIESRTASDSYNNDNFTIRPSTQVTLKNTDNSVKDLLKKIEELENENHLLFQKVNEVVQERDAMKIRVNELAQELNKKTEDLQAIVFDKEKVLEKLNVQETNEELKEELRLKDKKITDLTKLVEEIKQRQQMEYNRLQEELEEQTKKVLQLSKMENSLEFYKQKYEDYSRLSSQVSELDKQNIIQRNKIEELTAYNENLSNKVDVFREKIEAEKNKNISLDLEITRLSVEIENIRNEKKRLEGLTNQYEQKVLEQNRVIEKLEKEHEHNPRVTSSFIEFDRASIKGSHDFQDIISHLEKENEMLKFKQTQVFQPVIMDDGETEILKKENEILKKRCKQIEMENENLRNRIKESEDVKYVEKITNDNHSLKQEVEKVKKSADSARAKAEVDFKALKSQMSENQIEGSQNEITEQWKEEALAKEREIYELKEMNQKLLGQIEELNQKIKNGSGTGNKEIEEKLKDEINALQKEVAEKGEAIKKLNKKTTELETTAQNAEELETELDKKEGQIKELIDEIDMMRQVVEEVGEQKEEELRILSTALQELAARNLVLEREVILLKGGSFLKQNVTNKSVFNKVDQKI